MKKVLFLSMWLGFSWISNAQTSEMYVSGSGNAGNVIVSADGKVTLLDLLKLPNLEVIDVQGGYSKHINKIFKDRPAMSKIAYFPSHCASYGQRPVLLSKAITNALSQLTFYLVNVSLINVNDAGVVSMPAGSNAIGQLALALQIDNSNETVNGDVYVNRALFNRLTPENKAWFFIHEALIRLWKNNYDMLLPTTSALSDAIQVMYKNPQASSNTLAKQFCLSGIFATDQVGSQDYTSLHPSYLIWGESPKMVTIHNDTWFVTQRINGKCSVREMNIDTNIDNVYSYDFNNQKNQTISVQTFGFDESENNDTIHTIISFEKNQQTNNQKITIGHNSTVPQKEYLFVMGTQEEDFTPQELETFSMCDDSLHMFTLKPEDEYMKHF